MTATFTAPAPFILTDDDADCVLIDRDECDRRAQRIIADNPDDVILGTPIAELKRIAREYANYTNYGFGDADCPATAELAVVPVFHA